jgi:3-hydroxyisobutyrate dehydrogenase-like beta-hydroxyacid dehydrogenase
LISPNPRIGFIGFGEVTYYVSKGLKESGVKRITAYARAISDPVRGKALRAKAQSIGIELTASLEELVTSSELIISAVWGTAALEVAKQAANFMTPGKIFADLNNTAPSVKKEEAKIINAKGARFVDIGLFASPAQMGHKALMYVSGDGAEEFKTVMTRYGANVEIIPGEAGKATTIKTLVNIYYKGVQALCLELAVSAQKAGIPLKSLEPLIVKPVATLTREKELAFWIIRGIAHAERKIAELQDIIDAMKEWGIEPIMIEAARKRLNQIAQYKLAEQYNRELFLEDYQALIDTIDKLDRERKAK